MGELLDSFHRSAMSDILHGHIDVGGGVASHLQCPMCGHFSNSHSQKLSHLAASHPGTLNDVTVGRLGNILLYQSTARLYHCASCFYTSRDFTKIYKHIISRHCMGGGEDGGEEEKAGEEDTHEDTLKRKSISEVEEGVGGDEGGAPQRPQSDESVLMYDDSRYRCLICGWRNRLKTLSVNHVVKKHDIPKAYAAQAVRKDSASGGPPAEEEEEGAEGAGLTEDLLKEEMETMARVFQLTSNRFTCLTCGWKTKSRDGVSGPCSPGLGSGLGVVTY